ncbi:MAG TPA: YggS family pyridoxal phosphate-dependent enzyme [Candidatus Limnocylindrales bacterium]|nr:YggS family pyridoxal phosphate-dependent enzyme [Candidatus Limnocylindrales bacterium]
MSGPPEIFCEGVIDEPHPDRIRSGLESVRQRVDQAARAAGRDAAAVRIVAVTKKLDVDAIRNAYVLGQRDFGENYVQEAVGKIAYLERWMPDARWHFIGRLQSNKAAIAVHSFALLHGIDSLNTVAALSRSAVREDRTVDLLLQIRLGSRAAGGRASRGGIEADGALSFLEQSSAYAGIRFVGLMGVADPDLPARPQFARLRELAEDLATYGIERAPLGELSMGMTGDFEDAIAEGATIVRIGTAIFGERPQH